MSVLVLSFAVPTMQELRNKAVYALGCRDRNSSDPTPAQKRFGTTFCLFLRIGGAKSTKIFLKILAIYDGSLVFVNKSLK